MLNDIIGDASYNIRIPTTNKVLSTTLCTRCQMFQRFLANSCGWGSAEGGRTHLGPQHGGGVGDGHHDLVDQLHGNVAHHADPLGVLQGHRLWKLALLS